MQLNCLITLFLILFAFQAHSQETQKTQPASHALGPLEEPSKARAGTFFVKGTDGHRAAPNVSTDVHVEVTGLIARTEVVQRFTNPTAEWVEGVYVFPLPEDSAVDRLRMRVGARILEGEIQERKKARRTYEKAKSEGRKTSLVEQERPNIFTTSVANLGPNESLEVTIEYQEEVAYDQGSFSLRFPMVVAPRYIPPVSNFSRATRDDRGASDESTRDHDDDTGRASDPAPDSVLSPYAFDPNGWSQAAAEIAATHRIQPPVAHPSDARTNPVSISLRLNAGFRLTGIQSPSHPINVKAETGHVYAIDLEAGRVRADSDFILEWTPVVGAEPRAALFQEQWKGEHYSLLLVMPPKAGDAERVRLSRETIFVIDTSGSMQGESIVQAKRALDLALARLRPEDAFNIIRFASNHSALFSDARLADAQTIAGARNWVSQLQANGGTEMLPALRAALQDDARRGAVRQIVFITDGAIGNERALFRALKDGLGRSRLFAVGIGSAPNTHFMSKAAKFGRGTSTLISTPAEVASKMTELFAKLDSPVLQDLALEWNDATVEAWPAKLPDLYVGEPLVIAARTSGKPKAVLLTGSRDGERIELALPLASGAERNGVARLWARRKIASLVDSIHDGADAARVADDVKALGLGHHLVTRWTSLVAVDVTPTAPVEIELETREVPTLLPKGWSWRGLFGAEDPIAHDRALPVLAPTAAPRSASNQPPTPVRLAAQISTGGVGGVSQGRLPQGATPTALLLLLGTGLGTASLLVARAGSRAARGSGEP